MVLFADKTVSSMPERFVSTLAYLKALYKYRLPRGDSGILGISRQLHSVLDMTYDKV